jgi:acyl-coenzyme A thioesterase PaaI-like protein
MIEWQGPPLRNIDLNSYTMCYACGRDNPVGLKLDIRYDGDLVRTEFTPQEHHQGWPGVVHGGILNTILDEVMAYAAIYRGLYCVTARMEVRIRNTPLVGKRYLASAWITSNRKKLVEAQSEISLEDGTKIAEGKATMYLVEEA